MFKMAPILSLILALFLAETAIAGVAAPRAASSLLKRQASHSNQQTIWQKSRSDPVAAAQLVLKIKDVNNANAASWASDNMVQIKKEDNTQVPWASGISFDAPDIPNWSGNGFTNIPQTTGNFRLESDISVKDNHGNSAKIFYYVNKSYNPSSIKRAVVVWPGYYRESWLYVNYVGNAYKIAQQDMGVSGDEVLIIAPMFLNTDDKNAGGVAKGQIYFQSTGWEAAGVSRGPNNFTMSSFKLMDEVLAHLLDSGNFPNIEKVILAGHSMGAQANLRYAILTNRPTSDPLGFLIANPASFLYVDGDRNESTDNCGNYDQWPNGIGGSATVPAYARDRVENEKDQLVSNFRSRDVFFAFGLNDNGGTTGNCAKNTQGSTRVARGANYIISLSEMNGGFPGNFKAQFYPRISHQDYVMLAHPVSMQYMFGGSYSQSMLDEATGN
ncbi:hypothetical protein MCUN1_000099 [Malassezia cuniculi]|uniref:Uncharacterized protein n=1 Tax=Malassezia cuniculi TaxID=948313 RepID=A0AAF0J9G6_9BASI|nr:hypothetical protein MCUN1_000099 [Malassezia cuniculi]